MVGVGVCLSFSLMACLYRITGDNVSLLYHGLSNAISRIKRLSGLSKPQHVLGVRQVWGKFVLYPVETED